RSGDFLKSLRSLRSPGLEVGVYNLIDLGLSVGRGFPIRRYGASRATGAEGTLRVSRGGRVRQGLVNCRCRVLRSLSPASRQEILVVLLWSPEARHRRREI